MGQQNKESSSTSSSTTANTDANNKNKNNSNKDAMDTSDSTPLPTQKVSTLPKLVVVHPLVLLSVTDHYTRVAKDTRKRVVGILLGEVSKGRVEVTNSYAVPFEEDERDPSIWFVDFGYHENMFAMFKKVNARERVVGWYSTGPKIRAADIDIHTQVGKYCPAHLPPVYVIVDIQHTEMGIPTSAYIAVEQASDVGSQPELTFGHVASEISAVEAEEIGVGHLLRDVMQDTPLSLAEKGRGTGPSVDQRVAAVKALYRRLNDIHQYLLSVADGNIPVQHQIIYSLQDMFNLLPGQQQTQSGVAHSMAHLQQQSLIEQANDTMVGIYIATLTRSVVALHNLINNKSMLKELENKESTVQQGKKEEKEEKDKKGTEKDVKAEKK